MARVSLADFAAAVVVADVRASAGNEEWNAASAGNGEANAGNAIAM
jgi:hypothetical protein